MPKLEINPRRELGKRDNKIYGHFLKHFIVKSMAESLMESPFSDSSGFRQDVLEALQRIEVPIMRLPGGCFVSAYNWSRKAAHSFLDKA